MKWIHSKKRLTAYVLTALCIASTGFAATEHWNDASTTPNTIVATQAGNENWEQWKESWQTIQDDYEQVSLAPGRDATQMNLAWYSRDKVKAAEVRIAKSEDMSDARSFLGTCKTGTMIDGVQYYANKATIKDLKPDTTYYYQVKINGAWKDVQSFKTGNPDDFSFMYVGDPQIGASKGQTLPKETSRTAFSPRATMPTTGTKRSTARLPSIQKSTSSFLLAIRSMNRPKISLLPRSNCRNSSMPVIFPPKHCAACRKPRASATMTA